MNKYIFISSIFVCFLFPPKMKAQQSQLGLPVRIGIVTHSIGMPFKKIVKSPLSLGFSLGTTFRYLKNDNFQLGQTVDFTWYYHKELHQGYMLTTHFQVERTFNFGLVVSPKIGLGYLHTFNERDLYEVNASGSYEKVSDTGRSALVAGVGLKLAWELGENTPIRPFIDYDWKAQIPYSRFADLFPHSFLQLGVEYTLPSKN